MRLVPRLLVLLLSFSPIQLIAQRGLNLSFEVGGRVAGQPGAWSFYGKEYRAQTRKTLPAAGKQFLQLRTAPGAQDTTLAYFVQRLPESLLEAHTLRLEGSIRVADTSRLEQAGLFINAFSAEGEGLGFAHSYHQPLTPGQWTRVDAKLIVPDNATGLNLGGLFMGRGEAEFDDLRLFIDGERYGEPLAEADYPPAPPMLPDDPRVAWLRQYAHPLAGVDPEIAGTDDLRAFGQMVRDCTVVGLGESTHGSREIFQLKDRLFRYLHGAHAFGTFVLEGGLVESYGVNDYLSAGTGTPTSHLHRVGYWSWNTEEVAALIEGMRATGGDTPPRFAGIDLQNYTPAYRILEKTFADDAYLRERMVAMRNKLDLIRFDRHYEGGYTTPQAYLTVIDEVIGELYTAVEGLEVVERDRTWLRQMVRLIEQFSRMDASGSRDAFMAENTVWVQDYENDSKLVLWAHNEHVKQTGDWLGRHLSERLGDDYLSVGFTFSDGEYGASESGVRYVAEAQAPYPATYEYWLDRVGEPLFYLDLREIAADPSPFATWFQDGLRFRKVGTQQPWGKEEYQPEDLLADYDLLFFVGRSTASRPLPVVQLAE